MRIITIADDGTVTLELAADEARDLRADLDKASWKRLSRTARQLFHYLGDARPRPTPPRTGIFPGGGF